MADVTPGQGHLVGRDQELAQLRGWLAEALGGGGLGVVTGPPGIGKTRLAEELAARPARTATGRCGGGVEDQGAPPLWPWRRVLIAAGADTWGRTEAGGRRWRQADRGRPVPGGRGRSRRDDGRSEQAGLLVVLEDLQWADQASLFLLGAGAELRSRGCSCWPPAGRSRRPVAGRAGRSGPAAWGAAAAARGAGRVRAGRNPEGRRGGHDTGAGRVVHSRSEGNPLYVTTLARVLDGSRAAAGPTRWPGSWAAALRSAGWSGPCLRAWTTISVGWRRPAYSAAISARPGGYPCEREALRAALSAADQRAGPPVPGRPGWWRFTHALVRDGVYAAYGGSADRPAPAGRRALELAGRSPTAAGRSPGICSGRLPVRRTARRANGRGRGDAATDALAFEDAARYLATAVAAPNGPGATEGTGRVAVELATAEYRAGRFADSLSIGGGRGPANRPTSRRWGRGRAGGARGRSPGGRQHTGGAL